MIVAPIHCACLNPNSEILKLLLDTCPEAYCFADEQFRKPSHFAAMCSTPDNLKLLKEKNVDLKEGDKFKTTPLVIL